MGGEGSMQHMITTLRNNKALLRKRSMFKKSDSFRDKRIAYYKLSKGAINNRKLTKKELRVIRAKIKADNRKQFFIDALLLGVIIAIIGYSIYYLFV